MLVHCGALALLALASTGCLDQNDASPAAEEAVASELTEGSGDADLYKCMYPLCGGAGLEFDSRNLALRKCTFDARAGILDCDAHAVDSPRMPREFWDTRAAELACADGLVFSCVGTRDLLSCVCTSATAAADVKYGPVLKVKPKG